MSRRAVRAIVVQNGKLLVMHRNKFGQQYYILIGGGIKGFETPEQALVRQIHEETGLQATHARQVFIEEAGDPYGTQLIYLCAVNPGDVALSPNSQEAQINALGNNLHTPMWLPLEKLPKVSFRSQALRDAIINALKNGFPEQPVKL